MTKTIIRILIAFLAFINAVLMAKGMNPITIDPGVITETVSNLAAMGMILWTSWKNWNVTKEAKDAQKDIDAMKAANKEVK